MGVACMRLGEEFVGVGPGCIEIAERRLKDGAHCCFDIPIWYLEYNNAVGLRQIALGTRHPAIILIPPHFSGFFGQF